MSVVAVLGAGKVGMAIARSAVRGGHEVRVAASGAPEQTEMIVSFMAPGATAHWAADAVAGSDVVILATPLPNLRTLDADLLADRVVVDAMNHWEPTDGPLDDVLDPGLSTSETVAAHLTRSRVVKSLNHIGYHEMDDDWRPPHAPDRRALAAVSDDAEAAERVARLVETFGFDVVASTPLAIGVALEPGSDIFSAPHSDDEIDRALRAAAPIRQSA